jgi:tetratricopeptide (TPR) repeat protein
MQNHRTLILAVVAAALLLAQAPLFAQQASGGQPLPDIIGGGRPHGAHDPHVRLSADQQLKVALQHQAEGRSELAMATLDQAIERSPEHAGLRAVRGSMYLQQRQVAKALEDLEMAVALDPADTGALTNRAQAYRQFGRIPEALADLDQALALNPELVPARFNRGAIRYSSGDYRLALEDFDYCIALDPHDAAPYFNRAASRDALGDRTGAVEDLQRFVQLTDNDQWKETANELLARWKAAGAAAVPAETPQ